MTIVKEAPMDNVTGQAVNIDGGFTFH